MRAGPPAERGSHGQTGGRRLDRGGVVKNGGDQTDQLPAQYSICCSAAIKYKGKKTEENVVDVFTRALWQEETQTVEICCFLRLPDSSPRIIWKRQSQFEVNLVGTEEEKNKTISGICYFTLYCLWLSPHLPPVPYPSFLPLTRPPLPLSKA